MGPSNYQGVGFAGEANFKPSDSFEFILRTGYASGQSNSSGSTPDTFKAFYFNPNYHIGMIMFNYQLRNFSRPQTLNNPSLGRQELGSPYDNPIVDAEYIALSANWKPWDKWSFKPAMVYAVAPQTAANGQFFYNNWTRTMVQNNSGKDQSSSLGFEVDLGVTFQWDEAFQFSWDNGVYLPGSFYAFSNTATDNKTSAVFATSVKVGLSF
jgi:hypothetical protein